MSSIPRLPVGRSDLRIGILAPESWEAVCNQNIKTWEKLGGYEVGGPEKPSESSLFNFWTVNESARIDFPEGKGEGVSHVIGDRDIDAEAEYFRFPYLGRTEIRNRPSFIVFEVTGHVMLGIYFGNLGRPQLHILNPWPLNLGVTQFLDAYDVVAKSSKKLARKILYVDVAGELEKIFPDMVPINLQKDERVGFCTLWVGIMASKVAPILPQLTVAASKDAGSRSGVLSNEAATLYRDNVYAPLKSTLDAVVEATMKESPSLGREGATAIAVGDLAASAATTGKGGKRTVGRRTHRKKSSWKRRNQRSSSTVRRIRRSARRRGNII